MKAGKLPIPVRAEGLVPTEKAAHTARWAKTMTKVVIAQVNSQPPFWHVVNFLGAGKCESRGIVDLLAIRKCHKRAEVPFKPGDLFEIILIQVKGGGAKDPSAGDILRLQAVKKAYNAKDVVLSSWKKGSSPVFRRLLEDGWSEAVHPTLIFSKAKQLTSSKKTGVQQVARDLMTSNPFMAAGQGAATTNESPPTTRSAAARKAWNTRRLRAGAASEL